MFCRNTHVVKIRHQNCAFVVEQDERNRSFSAVAGVQHVGAAFVVNRQFCNDTTLVGVDINCIALDVRQIYLLACSLNSSPVVVAKIVSVIVAGTSGVGEQCIIALEQAEHSLLVVVVVNREGFAVVNVTDCQSISVNRSNNEVAIRRGNNRRFARQRYVSHEACSIFVCGECNCAVSQGHNRVAYFNRRNCNNRKHFAVDGVNCNVVVVVNSSKYECTFAARDNHAVAVQSNSVFAERNRACNLVVSRDNEFACRQGHACRNRQAAGRREFVRSNNFSIGNSNQLNITTVSKVNRKAFAEIRQVCQVGDIFAGFLYADFVFSLVADNQRGFFGRYECLVKSNYAVRISEGAFVLCRCEFSFSLNRGAVDIEHMDAVVVNFNVEVAAKQVGCVCAAFDTENSRDTAVSRHVERSSLIVDFNRVICVAVVGDFKNCIFVKSGNLRNNVVSNLEGYAVFFVAGDLEGLFAEDVSNLVAFKRCRRNRRLADNSDCHIACADIGNCNFAIFQGNRVPAGYAGDRSFACRDDRICVNVNFAVFKSNRSRVVNRTVADREGVTVGNHEGCAAAGDSDIFSCKRRVKFYGADAVANSYGSQAFNVDCGECRVAVGCINLRRGRINRICKRRRTHISRDNDTVACVNNLAEFFVH